MTSKPNLTERHKLNRKNWCLSKDDNYWDKTWFADESVFCLNYDKRGFVYYLDQSDIDDYYPRFEKNEKIMISGAISKRYGQSELKIWRITNLNNRLDERVNAEIYKEFILDLEQYATEIFPLPELPITFQIDRAKAHLSFAKEHLINESIFTGEYQPASSPDLNP